MKPKLVNSLGKLLDKKEIDKEMEEFLRTLRERNRHLDCQGSTERKGKISFQTNGN